MNQPQPSGHRGSGSAGPLVSPPLRGSAAGAWGVVHFKSADIARAASVWRARYASSLARSAASSLASIATANSAALAAPDVPIAKVAICQDRAAEKAHFV